MDKIDRTEKDCKCTKIDGQLEAVKWILKQWQYKPSPGYLSLGDWTTNQFIWLAYAESRDGLLADDDVLLQVTSIESMAAKMPQLFPICDPQRKKLGDPVFLTPWVIKGHSYNEIPRNIGSTDSRYWSIHDVQRYYYLDLHCEKVLFPIQYPNLRMSSPLGSYLWKSNTALKLPPKVYRKELFISLETTLKKLEAKEAQMSRLILSDQLFDIDQLDHRRRKTFFRILLNILSFQNGLQLVSFENLCCKRREGVRLIQQLACFNAHSLKYLFLWQFVLPNENPLLINYSYITGSGQYIPRPDTRQCFIHSLGQLKNLRVLALEYSHIADGTGSALLSLLPVINKPKFRFQLICREDQTPGRADAALGVGGYGIPDTSWKRVNISCPDIYLHMVFFRIRDYDNIRRFLVPSIPLREAHLQLGIDLKLRQRQDSDLSCFIRHIAYQYGSTLGSLSIHQWRFADFPLRRVFELMPQLVRFHYIGRVQDDVDLRRMLLIVSSGVCSKLQVLHIQIQDDKSKRKFWRQAIDSLNSEYEDIMKTYDIHFRCTIYKI